MLYIHFIYNVIHLPHPIILFPVEIAKNKLSNVLQLKLYTFHSFLFHIAFIYIYTNKPII